MKLLSVLGLADGLADGMLVGVVGLRVGRNVGVLGLALGNVDGLDVGRQSRIFLDANLPSSVIVQAYGLVEGPLGAELRKCGGSKVLYRLRPRSQTELMKCCVGSFANFQKRASWGHAR